MVVFRINNIKTFYYCYKSYLYLILLFTITSNSLITATNCEELDDIIDEIPSRIKSLPNKFFSVSLSEDLIKFYTLTDVNNDICGRESQMYNDELRNYTKWAFQMYDSSGKMPSGLLSFHLTDLGNYKECMDVSHYAPYPVQYCLIRIKNIVRTPKKYVNWDTFETTLGGLPAWKPDLLLGGCLPASCRKSDIYKHYTSITKSLNLSVKIDKYSCTSSNEETPYTVFDWIFVLLICFFVFLVFISTVIDCLFSITETSSFTNIIIKSFSAYKNGVELFNVRSSKSSLMELNGLRFISIMWAMASHHSLFMSLRSAMNYAFTRELYTKVIIAPLLNAGLAVDTFIVLSGILLSYNFIKDKESGKKFSLFGFYRHRLFRVLPTYIFTLITFTTIFERYFGDGPFWKYYMQRQTDMCRKHWWTNLLFINNFVHADQQCLQTTWYLSFDMQVYVLSPLVLIPLSRSKFFAQKTLPLLICTGIAIAITNTYIKRIPAGSLVSSDHRTIERHLGDYVTTYTKFPQWLIGIALGYIIKTTQEPIKLSRVTVTVCWIASVLLGICNLFGLSYFYQSGVPYNRVVSSLYTGLSSSVWALCIGWMIFACEMGYAGLVRTFLSWNIFQPLAKLTFVMYLTHFVLQLGIVANNKVSPNLEILPSVFDFMGEVTVIILVSPIFYLISEAPFINLEKNMKKCQRLQKNLEETKGKDIELIKNVN